MSINPQDVFNIITATVTAASIAVSILPIPKNPRWKRIYKLIDALALNIINKKR